MKRNIKFLLGVTALAGAYWLWKNNKAKPEFEYYSRDELGMPRVKDEFTLKIECERRGGTWTHPHCFAAPCRGVCVK